MRNNLIDKLYESFPNTRFVIYSENPLLVYHDSHELAYDDKLIEVFVDAHLECYGESGIDKAAIAYDYRRISSIFDEEVQLVERFSYKRKITSTLTTLLNGEPTNGSLTRNLGFKVSY